MTIHDKTAEAVKLTSTGWPVVTTWRTVTLENAKYAVKIYNEGLYGCVKNPDLDERARQMFANGLGSTTEQIARQVDFIGRDYGGAAGFKAAYSLVPDITRDIAGNRERYEKAATSAHPIRSEIPNRSTVEILYRPFVKPLHGKSNWPVWASKFWHFLNPDAFPIEDSRVDTFFVISDPNSVDKYLKLLKRFREFALSHEGWVLHLRQVDGSADGEVPCSENKLWDKVFYGLGELSSSGRAHLTSG